MSEKENKKSSKKNSDVPADISYVSLIDDPFGIRTLEISRAQEENDELPLDRDLEDIADDGLAAGADDSEGENDADSDTPDPIQADERNDMEDAEAGADTASDAPEKRETASDEGAPTEDASPAAEPGETKLSDAELEARASAAEAQSATDLFELADGDAAPVEAATNPKADPDPELDRPLETAGLGADPGLDLAGADASLDNLARALKNTNDARIEELSAEVDTAARAQVTAEAELARQIAEDQALARQEEEERRRAEEEAKMDPALLAALPKEPVPAEDGSLDLRELQSCIETLLFMSDKTVSVDKLREYLGPTFEKSLFEQAIEGLQARYAGPEHGIEVVAVANGFQFRTKPGRAALAKKLAKIQTQRISSGGMETLAIIAYRQPCMKEDVDKVRGVDSSYFIRGLLDRKLIRISGRSELPGRPMLYSTTEDFLSLFGLRDLSSMPSLRELEQMIPASQSNNPEDEDPKVKEMRRLVEQMKADNTRLSYDPREDEKILKEIREKVSAIPSSTPYLDEQKRLEKEAVEAAKAAAEAARAADPSPELPLEN